MSNQPNTKKSVDASYKGPFDEFKTVGCTFPNTTRVYTYKYKPQLLGRTLAVGDSVIVETKDGQKTIKVAEIHDEPQSEDKFPFKEILAWVDPKNEV